MMLQLELIVDQVNMSIIVKFAAVPLHMPVYDSLQMSVCVHVYTPFMTCTCYV
jgi:hypothetical protein